MPAPRTKTSHAAHPLYQGAKPADAVLPLAAFALPFCADARSPLGHASFYYPAMVYKTIPAVPAPAHAALLTLGAQFSHLQLVAWLSAVIALAIGMAALCV